MSTFPTGVSVVTASGAGDRACGMTCSSLASVTVRPPTLLVCLQLGSRTLQAVLDGGLFAINLLHARAKQTAELFSTPGSDRFAAVRWCLSDSGLPWLVDDAFALAECRVAGTKEVGDHMIVLGEVLGVTQAPDAPLMHGLRQFSAWPAMQPVAEAFVGAGVYPCEEQP